MLNNYKVPAFGISVREEIVSFVWESNIHRIDFFDIFGRGRVLNSDSEGWSSINIFDEFIDIFEILLGVLL